MSQLFVDEIREHTAGNGILIADNVVLLGTAPAYHTFPVNILFEVSGGQDATTENAYGLIVDLHGGSVVNPAAYLSAAEFTAASAPALGTVGYLLGVSAYLEPGAGTVHRWTWAYYAQANPSAGGDSVYNFRGENIEGAGAADHAQLSLGRVSGGTAHNYGIIIEDVTGTGAFAIKTGLGVVNFGDRLFVATAGLTLDGDATPIINAFQIGPFSTTVDTWPTFQSQLELDCYGQLNLLCWTATGGTVGSEFVGCMAGGTVASPTYPAADVYFTGLAARGYYPPQNDFVVAANLVFMPNGAWSSSNLGSKMVCYLNPPDAGWGNTLITAFEVTSSSLVAMNGLALSEATITEFGVFAVGPVTYTVTDPPAGPATFYHKMFYSNYGQLVLQAFDNNSNISNVSFIGQFANGTSSSPTYPSTGSIFVALRGMGWDEATSSWQVGGSLIFTSNQDWTASAHGGKLYLFLTANGATGNGTSVLTATTAGFEYTIPVHTVASASGAAGLRVPHGTAPSSPVDGDIWTTTAGIFVRINGVTVGPLT